MEGAPVFGDRAIGTLVVPFAVFLVGLAALGAWEAVSYPVGYVTVIILTGAAMAANWRGYLRAPLRIRGLSVAVGAVGVIVWIGLWTLDRELIGLGALLGGRREGFDPFDALGRTPVWLWAFLAVRFLGLTLIVPVIEEFFVRGFLMRYVEGTDWENLPLGRVSRTSVIVVTAYAVLSHPGEALAAAAWFGLVTWLYARTGSLWDCVVAHATTNLLLGVYVVRTGTWALW